MTETAPKKTTSSGRDVAGQDEIIYLDRSDDVETLLRRLEWVEGRHVVIVVPGSEPLLASEVSLQLLKRRAEALRLDVILVTRDGLTRRLAREVGLPAYRTQRGGLRALGRLQRKHRTPRRAVVRDSFSPEVVENLELLRRRRRKAGADHRPGDRFRLRTLPPRYGWASYLTAFLALLALAAGVVFILLMFVPEATITVVPATQPVSAELTVTTDLNAYEIDYEARIVPARVIETQLEGKASVPTTGQQYAPSARATGTIFFINKTSEEVVVPAGTVVRTSTGNNVRFTTVQAVTVPAGVGSRAEVEVVAVAPGPSGNVGAYLITTVEGGMSLRVAAVNEQPTHGGDVSQVNVVTQADKDRLKQELLQRLRQEALVRIQDLADEGEFVPPETLQLYVISEIYDKFVDEISDTVSLEIKATANAIAIASHDANAVALDALQATVPSRYYLAAEGLQFERGPVLQIDETRRVTFLMRASGVAVARAETRGLAELLQGQPLDRAERLLSERLSLKRPPEIVVRPAWFGQMPLAPFRIHVNVITELD